jgi:threonyl-tRNA synthetase
MIYKAEQHSYRDLPLRYAEFGVVYRYEDSGTLMGLMRVRGMTQNDAHIYCTKEQAIDELVAVMDMHKYYYKLFNITDFFVELALPDFKKKKDKYFDDTQGWETAVDILRQAAKKSDIDVIEKEGEAAFYGPKFDFNIRSAIGREFGASTNQLDFGSGERFGLKYIDNDGQEKTVPYVIHRAPLGSDERFIGFLIEHYGGAFPLWLAPEQLRIIQVKDSDELDQFVDKITSVARENNVRVSIDRSNESVGKKIRAAEMMKVPYSVVIGEKELESGSLTPRIRSDLVVEGKPEASYPYENFITTIANEAKGRVQKSSL